MNTSASEFQKIYTAFQPKIHRYLIHLIGEEEAEDLTQEVLIKAGQALPGFRGESSLSTWLYRIATHAAYDRLRSPSFQRTDQKKRWDPSIDEDLEGIDERASCTSEALPSVEQQVVKQEMSGCILGYIDKLPDNYRIVLLLSDLEELSNQEIAAILGVTLETVKIRLHRARARLREDFETHCEYYWVNELSWRVS